MNHSKSLIQKTLDFWQPYYDKEGIKLTEQDAIEILDNMTGLVKLLMELDKEYRDRKYKRC